MDPTPLQIREKWLRLSITMSNNMVDLYCPQELQTLRAFKTFLSNKVMPAWPGLIGWYGLHSDNANTCSIILRFRSGSMQDKSAESVWKQAREHFHDQVCDKVEIIDYGDASVDMVPRLAEFMFWQPFGMLPPELTCFYTE